MLTNCAELTNETNDLLYPWINEGTASGNLIGRGGRPKEEALGEAPPAYRPPTMGAAVGAGGDNKKEKREDSRRHCSCSHME